MEQEVVVGRMSDLLMALEAAVARLEERVSQMMAAADGEGERIVATAVSAREEELERKLAEAEEKLARLEAAAGAGGRKTAGVGRMFAKDGGEVGLAAALDGALGSLSVEQRIAVKAELLRAGALQG